MIKIILLVLIMVPAAAFAEKEELTTFEYTKQINMKLEDLKNLAADKYRLKVDQSRELIELYIDHKKRACRGEFSTVVLNGGEASSRKNLTPSRRKLSTKEKKLCFREMKAIQTTYINNMFQARKRFLEYLHQKRIGELSKARELALQELQRGFSSIRR